MEKLPPVPGFWSLTLYNEHHFFHPDELDRYSFGTKIENLHRARDGSLTLTASATRRRTGSGGPTGPSGCWHSFHPSRVSQPGRVFAVLEETRVARRGSGKRRTV